jgi:hypothetical protein
VLDSRDLAPIPQLAVTFAPNRSREPRLTDDHGRPLMGHAEDLGDLGEADGLRRHGLGVAGLRHVHIWIVDGKAAGIAVTKGSRISLLGVHPRFSSPRR